MKSRGVYETPGGTILLAAHRAMESLTLDREAMHLKDSLMPRYAELIYYGFWFSPEREMLQALIDKSQEHVEGEVTLKLYKGNVIVIGRSSPKSLYASKIVTFEDDAGAYDQKDAEGFIKLNALRLRLLGKRNAEARGEIMWPDTRLLDLFGIELPIVQAPMANATAVDMAVAVANAGGLGSFPCAALTDDKVAEGVAAIRSRTNRPINLNFFCHKPAPPDEARDAAWLKRLAPYYAELGAEMPKLPLKASIVPFTAATCAVVEQLAPAVVSFHFGLPDAALVARVKAAGCKIISSATSLREAQFLAERGVDAIIAQGAEAGGHRGMFIETDVATQIGTLALVHEIVNAVATPVIAAGGIVDGRGIAAAFALGATGCAARHRLSRLPGGHDLSRAPCGAGRARPADRHHQCAERTPGALDPHALRARARPAQRRHPQLSAGHARAPPAPRQGRSQRLRRFLVALGRSVPRAQPQPWGRRADQSACR